MEPDSPSHKPHRQPGVQEQRARTDYALMEQVTHAWEGRETASGPVTEPGGRDQFSWMRKMHWRAAGEVTTLRLQDNFLCRQNSRWTACPLRVEPHWLTR